MIKKILFVLFPLLLTACGQKIEGTYSNNMTGVAEQKISWTFHPDKTAQLSIGSTQIPAVMPFEVNGNKITVQGNEKGDIIFTILDDGSLVTEGLKYTKETAQKPEQTSAQQPPQAGTVASSATATEKSPPVSSPAPQMTATPSFDCAKASSSAEKLICSNEELASLDVEMMSAYKQLADGNPDKNALKKEQINWIKSKRDACTTVACMADAYHGRINEMEAAAQYLSKPAEFR